jgi:hypothetical protein
VIVELSVPALLPSLTVVTRMASAAGGFGTTGLGSQNWKATAQSWLQADTQTQGDPAITRALS